MDKINIYGLKIYAHHGMFPEETKIGQDFIVNAAFYVDTTKAGLGDDLTQSIDYGAAAYFIKDFLQNHTFKLLEAAAEYLARALLLKYKLLKKIDLEIQKPQAPIGLPFETVSVEITRSWHRVYLSFGSNLGDSEAYIREGLSRLEHTKGIRGLWQSMLIRTAPYGMTDQPEFLNGCAALDTIFTPEELLNVLHGIEAEAGRERKIYWGPRTLDLDIVFYDDLVMETEDLTIPHADMQNRLFVLEPLAELCPNKVHPVLRQTVSELLECCRNQ